MEPKAAPSTSKGIPWFGWIALAAAGYFAINRVTASIEEMVAQRRGRLWQLYDRNRGLGDATPAQMDKLRARIPEISRMAVELYDAAGTFNDNEDAVYSVFRQLRSKFELLWLNKTFSYAFSNPSSAPQLGAYLDDFLNDSEWTPIVRAVEQLPAHA